MSSALLSLVLCLGMAGCGTESAARLDASSGQDVQEDAASQRREGGVDSRSEEEGAASRSEEKGVDSQSDDEGAGSLSQEEDAGSGSQEERTGSRSDASDPSLRYDPGTRDRLNNYVDWGIYRGDLSGIQYSELAQITTENVHLLEPAWEYRHGDPNGPSMYSNPIIVDGLLYFTTPKVNAVALDAATGEEVWTFVHGDYNEVERDFRGRNRGVAYWENPDGSDGRIFNFVKDRVYAIDAKFGALIEEFGEGGFIDLRKNLPVDPQTASIEVTTPGIVYRDFLIVGSRVPEGNESTPGDVRAYDARTGEFRWIFHTIPQPGELGYETWEWQPGITYGGANPWGGFTVDEERGWVFFATGSAAGDFIYGGTRKGKNLFASTVLALDATTGERVWHYQTIHHDIFDYDNPPAPILATITSADGSERDVAVQLTKMGFTFVLNRETGEPVFPVVELPVPPSKVPGEEAWPTQPFPLKPPPLVRQGMYESDVTNITPEAHAAALEEFRKYEAGQLFTPASRQGVITLPGHQGGMEWGGAAFDPATNVMYVNANEAPTINRLLPLEDESESDSPVARGRWIYNANCTACHGINRSGNPPLYPPLTDLALGEDEIRHVIRQGRGIMPAFGQLDDDQLHDLVTYLHSDFDAGADADAGAEGGDMSWTTDPNAGEPDAGAGEVPLTTDPLADAPAAERAPGKDAQSGVVETIPSTADRGTIARSIPQYVNDAPFFEDPDGYPAISPPWGTLNAVDLDKGEILWKVPLGEYPELVAKGIRNTGAKNFGGPVLTAGDVVFIAATPDEKIRAFDKRSGAVLWEYELPAGGYATPSTYMIDGTQYVVIAAGGGGKPATPHSDAIIAFALPEAERRAAE